MDTSFLARNFNAARKEEPASICRISPTFGNTGKESQKGCFKGILQKNRQFKVLGSQSSNQRHLAYRTFMPSLVIIDEHLIYTRMPLQQFGYRRTSP